jgi:hypothetical protein
VGADPLAVLGLNRVHFLFVVRAEQLPLAILGHPRPRAFRDDLGGILDFFSGAHDDPST